MYGRAVALFGASSLLAVAGCGGERTPAAQGAAKGPAAGSGTSAAASGTPTTAASGPSLRVASSPTYGTYLTDRAGRALYLLEADGRQAAGACTGMCRVVWPPLAAAGGAATAADSAVRASLIGTLQRPDGPPQVTYGGRPLYYYIGDGGPGQTNGQHVEDSWGEWYLVSPGGGEVDARARNDRGEGGRGRGGRGGDDRR